MTRDRSREIDRLCAKAIGEPTISDMFWTLVFLFVFVIPGLLRLFGMLWG